MGLQDERAALADTLTDAGIKTYASAPAVFSGGGLVEAGQPYVESGTALGTYTVRHELYLLVDASPTWADRVDEMVGRSLEVLEDTYIVEDLEISTWKVNEGRLFFGAKLILTSLVNRQDIFN